MITKAFRTAFHRNGASVFFMLFSGKEVSREFFIASRPTANRKREFAVCSVCRKVHKKYLHKRQVNSKNIKVHKMQENDLLLTVPVTLLSHAFAQIA